MEVVSCSLPPHPDPNNGQFSQYSSEEEGGDKQESFHHVPDARVEVGGYFSSGMVAAMMWTMGWRAQEIADALGGEKPFGMSFELTPRGLGRPLDRRRDVALVAELGDVGEEFRAVD